MIVLIVLFSSMILVVHSYAEGNQNLSGAGANTTEVLPVADFLVSYVPAPAPLTVEFKQNSEGTITQYDWNFGDGTRSTDPGPNHIHTFWKDGNYTVSLTVAGPGGTSTKIYPSVIMVGGSYWITFNPIGPHSVGDIFNVSGKTNLPVGTEFDSLTEIAGWLGGPRNSPVWTSYVSGSTTVVSGVGRNNTWSFQVNTTGLLPEDYVVYIVPHTGFLSPSSSSLFPLSNASGEPMANSSPVVTVSMNGIPTPTQSIPAPLSPALILLAMSGTGAFVISRQKRGQ
jgi:PKD repeat protein